MSKQIKGLLYFFATSARHSFIVFWSILLAILFVTLTISYLLKGEDGFMTLTFTAPMYFYCGIFSFIIVRNWMPFLIKIGATRKNILISTGIFFVAVSAIFSLLGSVIQELATIFANKIDLDVFSFIHLANIFEDTWYTRILIDASIMLLCFSLLLVISLLYYKYGTAIGTTVMAALFVGVIFSVFKGWLANIVINIYNNLTLNIFWQVMLIAVVLYGLSWFFMRRLTIVTSK